MFITYPLNYELATPHEICYNVSFHEQPFDLAIKLADIAAISCL